MGFGARSMSREVRTKVVKLFVPFTQEPELIFPRNFFVAIDAKSFRLEKRQKFLELLITKFPQSFAQDFYHFLSPDLHFVGMCLLSERSSCGCWSFILDICSSPIHVQLTFTPSLYLYLLFSLGFWWFTSTLDCPSTLQTRHFPTKLSRLCLLLTLIVFDLTPSYHLLTSEQKSLFCKTLVQHR